MTSKLPLCRHLFSGLIDQSKLLHVADVDVATLGQAYHAMQNGREEWVDDPRVTVKPGLEETIARSLSAGDVLEVDGQRHLVLLLGYHLLQPGDTQGPTSGEVFQADLKARKVRR